MVYYILKDNEMLKRYYSAVNSSENLTKDNEVIYSNSLREAKMFETLEEAVNILDKQSLAECVIIDQNGQKLKD